MGEANNDLKVLGNALISSYSCSDSDIAGMVSKLSIDLGLDGWTALDLRLEKRNVVLAAGLAVHEVGIVVVVLGGDARLDDDARDGEDDDAAKDHVWLIRRPSVAQHIIRERCK